MQRLVLRCCGTECAMPASLDLRGLLGFWLLWELRLGPLIGAQLAERLAWRRGEPVSPGTLYPALAGLQNSKLVKKSRSGRETQYRITDAGRTELDCARSVLSTIFQDVLGAGATRTPRS